MSKGRRRKPTKMPPRSRPLGMKTGQAPPLSDEEQVAATARVTELLRALSRPPEGFLPLLDRLEVPYRLVTGQVTLEPDTFATNPSSTEQWLLIKMTDLIDGEERNQAQGSLFNQVKAKPANRTMSAKDIILQAHSGGRPLEDGT